jgi:hypothetical protein
MTYCVPRQRHPSWAVDCLIEGRLSSAADAGRSAFLDSTASAARKPYRAAMVLELGAPRRRVQDVLGECRQESLAMAHRNFRQN